MSEPAILFVKPKAISQSDKKALQTAGVIVVEVENVADVKLVRASPELSSGALLLCAARAIAKSPDWTKAAFANAVCASLEVKQP